MGFWPASEPGMVFVRPCQWNVLSLGKSETWEDIRAFQIRKHSEPALAYGNGNIPMEAFERTARNITAADFTWLFRSRQFQ